jgi:hypothetical protein
MTSINTVRQILDKVYGNYSLEDNYCYNVGRSNRRPENGLKVYRFTANGQTSDWKTAREIVDLLGPVADRRK